VQTVRIIAGVVAALTLAAFGCAAEPDSEPPPSAVDRSEEHATGEVVEDDSDDDGDGEVEQVAEEDPEPETTPEDEAVAAYQAFLDAVTVAANGDEGPLAALTTDEIAEVVGQPPLDEDGQPQAVIGQRTADPVSVEVGDDGTVLIEDCQIDRRRFVPLHEAGAEVPERSRAASTSADSACRPDVGGYNFGLCGVFDTWFRPTLPSDVYATMCQVPPEWWPSAACNAARSSARSRRVAVRRAGAH